KAATSLTTFSPSLLLLSSRRRRSVVWSYISRGIFTGKLAILLKRLMTDKKVIAKYHKLTTWVVIEMEINMKLLKTPKHEDGKMIETSKNGTSKINIIWNCIKRGEWRIGLYVLTSKPKNIK
ncbi:hypothetical protein, partial [Vibrio cholerae]